MDVIGIVAHHGYLVTLIVLFVAAMGLPLPVAVTLMAAGAASHQGLRFEAVFGIAWSAATAGDLLLFLGGRYTGWWLLAGICRLSLNPEQCIFTSAESFYRRGAQTLLFSKFIPGLGTIAAPLAGSLNMRLRRFLSLMAIGEAIYCFTWIALGYLFYGFIRVVASWIQSASHAVVLVLLLLALGYALMVLLLAIKSLRYREIERITAHSLRQRIEDGTSDRLVVIADVRSHDYYDPGMQRIKNSIRVEPNRLQEELEALKDFMAPECDIYIYCSCIRDTTSVRVAHALKQANFHTKVIQGGMKAWIKAGGETELVPEGDVRHLPRFD